MTWKNSKFFWLTQLDPRILPFYARKFIIANHKNNIWLYFLKIKLSFLICYKGLCMKYIHIFLPTSSPLPFCLTSTYNCAHILHAEPLIIEFIVVMFFVIFNMFSPTVREKTTFQMSRNMLTQQNVHILWNFKCPSYHTIGQNILNHTYVKSIYMALHNSENQI